MHEILRHLPAGSFVLDLGCDAGSFLRSATLATAIRFDRNRPHRTAGESFIQGDAALLPFRDRTFAAVVCNHSLEHFEELSVALTEIARVIQSRGALFVAVPDASTFTDKLYRWLARGGGHVNAFTSSTQLAQMIEECTGLKHAATRTLCSSLSFLNRRNSPKPVPKRLLLLGSGSEWSLHLYVWISRRLDRLLRLRTSIYGWALYFGELHETVDTTIRRDVCIRCGSSSTATTGKRWQCERCGAPNLAA